MDAEGMTTKALGAARDELKWTRAEALTALISQIITQLQRSGQLQISVATMVRSLALQIVFAEVNNGLTVEELLSAVTDARARFREHIASVVAKKGGAQGTAVNWDDC